MEQILNDIIYLYFKGYKLGEVLEGIKEIKRLI